MSGYTIAWLFWLAMAAVIEIPALLNKAPGDTLSEHVWRWFSIRDKARGWQARRFVLLTFMVWLTVHFLTGGWV
jgi:hypothetical protein